MSRLREFYSYVGHGHFDDKRILIVAEAAKLFADKGIQATSLEELAKRFKMTRPALYNYFTSKDEIIEEILNITKENSLETLEQLSGTKLNGAEKVRAISLRYANDSLNDFGRFQTIVQQSTLNARCRKLMNESHRIILDGMLGALEAGVADGSVRPCRSKIIAFSIFGALNSINRYFDPKGELTKEQVIEMTIETFMRGIEAK